jgi:hypothetical protein
MAGTTPRLGLEYLDASQAQPEVPLNQNADKLDEAFGSVWVEAFGESPGERLATKLIFANTMVEPQTDGSVLITPEGSGSGGGGSPVDVTDGTTTVSNVTAIRFTNGATVSEASAGVADVYVDPVSGGSGGGGNLTPDSHPSSPDASDDEFEEISLSGWSLQNVTGSATATVDGMGDVHLLSDATSGANNFAIIKALASPSAAWTREFGSVFMANGGSSPGNSSGGLCVRNSANGKYVKFGFYETGAPAFTNLIQRLTNLTTESSNPIASGGYPSAAYGNESLPLYMRLSYDGSTTLTFGLSRTGRPGTWTTIGTEAVATFLGAAPTDVGLIINSAVSSAVSLFCDFDRRTA